MCEHSNIISDKNGTSTCLDCSIHFDKSFCSSFTTNHNGPSKGLVKSKSTITVILEKEFGIVDSAVLSITEKLFNLTTDNKRVKGTNKKSILCAALYYASHHLEKPMNFDDMLSRFEITHKNGAKGLKLCQIAIQECLHPEDEVKEFKGAAHSFASTHKENLTSLIVRYNIPYKNYEEIENIVVVGHQKKNKVLNDRVSTLWISCIFFWMLKINPHIDPEDFISINNDHNISLSQLRLDLEYLKNNLN
jgi:hypothetical protein